MNKIYVQSVNGVVNLIGGAEVGLFELKATSSVVVREYTGIEELGWVDDGTKFVPSKKDLPVESSLGALQSQRLESLYKRFLSENEITVSYMDKVYGNTSNDKDNIDDLITAFDDGFLPMESVVQVSTYLGAEKVDFTYAKLKQLRGARLFLKNTLWNHHDELAAQIRAAQTVEELELIPEW